MTITPIPPNKLWCCWSDLTPYFIEAAKLSGGRVGVDDLLQQATNGAIQVWVAEEDSTLYAVVITRICQYPKKNMLSVQFATGTRMTGWLKTMINAIKAYAVYNQCQGVEIVGRTGWIRLLSKYGMQETASQMELSL